MPLYSDMPEIIELEGEAPCDGMRGERDIRASSSSRRHCLSSEVASISQMINLISMCSLCVTEGKTVRDSERRTKNGKRGTTKQQPPVDNVTPQEK